MGHEFENLSGTYKIDVKGEIKEYDLSDPEIQKKVADLLAKGNAADQKWEEIAGIRKEHEAWNRALMEAAEDDEAAGKLRDMIEVQIGRPLTKKESKDFDDLVDDTPKTPAEVEALKKDFQELKNMIYAKETNREIERIEAKYGVSIDREQLFAHANKNNIGSLEAAFKDMSFDSLVESEKKKWLDEEAKRKKEIKEAQSGSQKKRTHVDDKAPPKEFKGKDYDDVAADILESAKAEGRSFFD